MDQTIPLKSLKITGNILRLWKIQAGKNISLSCFFFFQSLIARTTLIPSLNFSKKCKYYKAEFFSWTCSKTHFLKNIKYFYDFLHLDIIVIIKD